MGEMGLIGNWVMSWEKFLRDSDFGVKIRKKSRKSLWGFFGEGYFL